MKPIKNPNDVFALMSVCRKIHPKYFIMLHIGFCSGLRVSDILDLRVKDVCCKPSEINGEYYFSFSVTEKKTKKNRTITFCKNDYDKIADYMLFRGLKLNDFLIYSTEKQKNKHLSRSQAWRVIRREALKLGIDVIGTHSMRKTFALEHFRKHKDIMTVQKLLNHKHLTTTLHYLLGVDGINNLNI